MEKMKKDFIAYELEVCNVHNTYVQEHIHEDRIIKIQQFFTEYVYGSFFSCIYKGKLRIHIVFSEDSSDYNAKILELIKETIEISNISSGKVWICNYNRKIINYLQDKLSMKRNAEPFRYESLELIMPREKFAYRFDETLLEARPYQRERIDEYLELLTTSMSFKIPPFHYGLAKDTYMKEFEILSEKHAFEAFWLNQELVGLYWLEDTEIDHLAVATKYQHLGYGQQILSRAIEVILQNKEADCAWLLVVGWNIKAFNFYKKYGMEEKNVYYVPYEDCYSNNE